MKPIMPNNSNTLELATQVCKRVQEVFPYKSPTKTFYENPHLAYTDKDLSMKLRIKQAYIMEARGRRAKLANNPIEFFKQLIEDTKRLYAFNCRESSYLTYLGLKMNGIKDCQFIKPRTVWERREIDHVLLRVNDEQNPNILVDTWANFVDGSTQALEKFSEKLQDLSMLKNDEKIEFIPRKENVLLNDNEVEQLRKFIPQLDLNT